MKYITFIIFLLFLSSCNTLQNSSRNVLENAGEVVNSGSGKLWVNEGETEEKVKRQDSRIHVSRDKVKL